MKIEKIDIIYEDGHMISVSSYELEKLKKMVEAVSLLERAKTLYDNLESLFGKR